MIDFYFTAYQRPPRLANHLHFLERAAGEFLFQGIYQLDQEEMKRWFGEMCVPNVDVSADIVYEYYCRSCGQYDVLGGCQCCWHGFDLKPDWALWEIRGTWTFTWGPVTLTATSFERPEEDVLGPI